MDSGAVLEVVMKSILEAFITDLDVVVLVKYFLSTLCPFLHGEGFIKDAQKNEVGIN
jgi:hypothetical protein